MDSTSSIRTITLVLTFVAGFCDTVTFVAANELFSAHVTGNFIVLAYDLVNHSDTQAWLKLLTFPVFTIAVMSGRLITKRQSGTYVLLGCEGALLVISGVLAFLVQSVESSFTTHLVTMLTVFGMGLQNAFGKLYSQETYGPTTVMTGTVTQAALDVIDLLISSTTTSIKWESLKKTVCVVYRISNRLPVRSDNR